MGLSLRPLGKKLWETITPQNEEAQRQNEASNRMALNRLQSIQNPRGALADPSRRQQFTQEVNNQDRFNVGAEALKSFTDTLTNPQNLRNAPRVNLGSWRGSGLAEDFINSPYKIAEGGVELGQGQIKEGIGDVATGAIEGPLGLLPIGRTAQAGLKAPGILNKVATGARAGLREGTVYGAAYGAGQAASENAPTADIIERGVVGGVTGGLAGGVLGGAVPIAGAGVKSAVNLADNRVPLNEVGSVPAPKVSFKNETSKVSQNMSTVAEAERNRYKVGFSSKARSKVASSFDPYSELVKIDKAYAKKQGVKYRDLPASERLDYLADKTAYSNRQAEEILRAPTRTGQSAEQLIQKYGEGTPEGKEFNNYTNAKFDLEFRAKHKGKPIQNQYTDEDLASFVRDYEMKNPDAIVDTQTKKALNDQAIDIIADAGAISRKEAEFVKNYYENAVPLSRITPEDLSRVEIGGKSVGSLGRQSVLQKLEGNSQLPLDDSFAPLVNRINKAVQQANRATLAKKTLERSQEGVVDNSKLLVGAGNKATRKEVRFKNQQINQSIADIEQKLKTAETDEDISVLQQQLKDLQEGKQINKETIAQFGDDPTTGKQTISGLIDGEPFKLEVSPELGRALQGLDEQKLNVVLKGMKVPIKVFQTAWTGFLNPIFSGMSFALYDTPMTVINSKLGFRTFGARAIAESLKSFKGNTEFQKALARSGAQTVGGSQLPIDATRSAEAIAARKNIFSKIKFNTKNPKEALDSLDILGGKLANSTRTRVAKAHYINAKKGGMSEEQALAEAAYAYNNVLPNYGRTSNLARQMNSLIPYVTASAAGTRSLASALRNNPYSAVKLAGVGIAPMIGATAYSLSTEEGQEFYKDMIDSKKQYILDNNFVIVLPGASKNPKTGEWKGILKIPVAPELRALNQIAWRETREFTTDESGASPARVAGSLFDFSTGGLRSQENPLGDTARIAVGLDPRSSLFSNDPLVKGDTSELPKNEQVYETTSGAAKALSKITGDRLSPIQVDSILSQFSTTGQLIQNKGGTPAKTLAGAVTNRFTGAFGKSEGNKFFESLDSITKGIPASDDKKAFSALHAKKNDEDRSLDKQAEKYKIFLARPKVFEAEKKLNDWNKSQGKPGNPLFDLTPEQQQKVMRYRGAKDLNSAKQAYDKNGEPLFTSLGLDEKWYDDFRTKENDFYTAIKGSDDEDNPLTYSGAVKPKPSPELQKKLDYYYTLPKGTGERSDYIKANPEILDQWAEDNQFTNAERVALGLKITGDRSGGSGFASGSRGGGRKSAGSIYKYAVKLNAGGKVKSPKVSVSKGKPAKASVKTASKPKVKTKKSLV